MSCVHWKELLVEQLYEELERDKALALEHHLADCAECRHELEQLRQARSLLSEAKPEVPTLPRVVMLRQPTFHRPWMAFAAGFILCALLIGGGIATGVALGPKLGGSQSTTATVLEPLPQDAGNAQAPQVIDGTPVRNDFVSRDELNKALANYGARFDERLQTKGNEILTRVGQQPPEMLLTQDELNDALSIFDRQLENRRRGQIELLVDQLVQTEARLKAQEDALRILVLSGQPGVRPE
ncbi:hypothetical protein ABI59_05455 [Acidobacteria bacterium Mor1]|nr:hypothetical protein ABI59_05455 [Acidobacteria bacterium Mor1]